MRAPRHIPRIAAIAALCAGFAIPAQAAAEYYVPPGNSAANQYTESFPGAGGESGGKHKGVTPAETLGSGNAKKLEKHGDAGKAAAEVAAETAPAQLNTTGGSPGSGGGNTGGTGGASHNGGSGAGNGSGSQASSGSGGQPSGNGTQSAIGHGSAVEQPQGSSGLGQVVGQATGAGNGGLGLWLLVAILLTLAGSIAYRVRSRNPHPGAHP
jgi:hypothetical protein